MTVNYWIWVEQIQFIKFSVWSRSQQKMRWRWKQKKRKEGGLVAQELNRKENTLFMCPISPPILKCNLTLKKGKSRGPCFLSELFSLRHPLSCTLDLAMKIHIISVSQQGLYRKTGSVLAHTSSNLRGWDNRILLAEYYSEGTRSELQFLRTSTVQTGFWARLIFLFCFCRVLNTKVCVRDIRQSHNI